MLLFFHAIFDKANLISVYTVLALLITVLQVLVCGEMASDDLYQFSTKQSCGFCSLFTNLGTQFLFLVLPVYAYMWHFRLPHQ